jgi:hypothetical protein
MITDGQPSITTIHSFLGMNMNRTGETQLKLGEAADMKNFRITKDYKLEKMYGYEELYKPNARVRANWVGKLGNTEMNIYVANGKVYKGGTTPTQLGTLTDAETSIFEFDKNLYFLNGSAMYRYDGTTFQEISVDSGDYNPRVYVPIVKISCTPAGVGEDYEQINLLTGYRKVWFSGDGTSTTFNLPESGILVHSNHVWVNGTSTSAFTYSSTGSVTFTTAPSAGTNNVVIQYYKSGTSTAPQITKNKYAQKYGLANDTRVFLYGNSDAKNRIYFSDLGNGVPDPTYYPANNFIDVGSSNYEITDISRQYDRLIISKEAETYYCSYEPIIDSLGNTIVTFPTYPLNTSHGMVAKGKGQVLDNYVTTIDASGIIQWLSTNTKDERNASVISERINEWLQGVDLSKAVTLDYQEEKEYWIGIDKEIMIYNYANSTFFKLELPDYVRTLTMYKGIIYMGTDTSLMKWNKNKTTYDGKLINAIWYSGFYDFDVEYKRKTMRILWFTLKPQVKTYMSVNYITDRNVGPNEREFSSLNVSTFSYPFWNYADFTYNSQNAIKPFKVKLKAKKFAFLQLIIKSNKIDHKLIVDSISIQKAYGGNVK